MSMTGFGRGTVSSAARAVTVELKSLNSKQLDLQARMPQVMREMELDMRNRIAARLERGKVELSVTEEMIGTEAPARLDPTAVSYTTSDAADE